MCNPMCATAQRMAELEAENARLREALRSVTSVCRILRLKLRQQAEEVSDLHEIATTALRSTTQKEATDAG